MTQTVAANPWNLMPMSKGAHKLIRYRATLWQVAWYGTPGWAKAGWISSTGRGLDAAIDQ